MELVDRVAQLERRVAQLEEQGAEGERSQRAEAPGAPPGEEERFWALEGLRGRLAEEGHADGGVLFAGSVRLPQEREYAWQYALPTPQVWERDWPESAASFAALGNPARLRILHEVLGGRSSVAQLAEVAELGTTGQIYHHLRQLTAAGWLQTTTRGRYDVPPARVVPLLVMLAASQP